MTPDNPTPDLYSLYEGSEGYEQGKRDALAGLDADVRYREAGMWPPAYMAGYEVGALEAAEASE
jgi:hypothetical protein